MAALYLFDIILVEGIEQEHRTVLKITNML